MSLRQIIYNYLEQFLSTDADNQQLYAEADLQNIIMALLTPDGIYPSPATPSNGILGGFQATPGTGLVVSVNPLAAATSASGVVPGIGFQFDPTNLAGASNADASTPGTPGNGIALTDSPFRLFFLNSVASLPLAAADPTNPRIDLIEAQWNQTVSNKTTRNIWTQNTPTSGQWTPTAIYKNQEPDVTLKVKTGTPGASPVAPTVDANFIPIALVAVAANATSLVQGNITDQRPLISLAIRNNNVMIADDGTVHTISLTQVSPGTYSWVIN
jgi:hypothetical protein